jgi:hypothetical protein
VQVSVMDVIRCDLDILSVAIDCFELREGWEHVGWLFFCPEIVIVLS